MRIDLKDLFVTDGASLPISHSLDMSEFEMRGVYPLKAPVSFTGKVENRAGAVSLTGTVQALYEAPCDRCGVEASSTISFDIAYTLVTSMASEEQDDYIVLTDHQLDVDDLLTSDVILSLPTKHLCSADCMGICSGCGANLNTGSCSCQKEETAFGEALRKFLEE